MGNAGVHWANTWSSFEQAYTVYLMHRGRGLHGVGFVLTADDPFVGVDKDNCLAGQAISPPALAVINHLQSYTEVSPSGRGLRILVACPEYTENARTEALEAYSHSRFVTLTGHHVAGTPATISHVQREQIERFLPRQEEAQTTAPAHRVDASIRPTGDLDLWQRIFEHDRLGGQHLRRFQGDTSLDRGDHSLTVIRLLNCLARWTGGDPVKMRSMMLLSPLAN
ncbi:MAG: hypothetical protein IT329_24325 [Caldilineaceae bacterium]|nr:hypothetical protein [Caldilineaceae bacterium]